MMLTRKNLLGGRRLKEFPLVEETGHLGFKLGYCEGCNEPVLVSTLDTQEILAHLFYSQKKYKKLLSRLEIKETFKKRFIKWIIGKLGEYPQQQLVEN